jgi:hypothetical protein
LVKWRGLGKLDVDDTGLACEEESLSMIRYQGWRRKRMEEMVVLEEEEEVEEEEEEVVRKRRIRWTSR